MAKKGKAAGGGGGKAKKAKVKAVKVRPVKEKPKRPVVPPAPVVITSYEPVVVKCPYCKKTAMTTVIYNPQRSVIGRLIKFCTPTCCLRMTGSFRDAQHFCSNPRCKKLIAVNTW